MSSIESCIDLFKVVAAKKTDINLTYAMHGFVTDFTPTPEQVKALKSKFKPLPITTLFSVEERKHADLDHLISKQILHYIEVYGLDSPGLFNLEFTSGSIATLSYIRAVTEKELAGKVLDLIYANRPISDIKPVLEIISDFGIQYDINEVKNNELRVALFSPSRDVFKSGDDAVRWLCYDATDSALLIKSKAVIASVNKGQHKDWFFSRHMVPLAQVFNRHKRLILACKNPETAATINKISKLSKTKHVPIHEPISKRFISERLKKNVPTSILDTISLRDKLKYLNLIEYKLLGLPYESFNIRNGKVWFEWLQDKKLNTMDLSSLKYEVLDSISLNLSHLKESTILLDPHVDYGLPVSRKQTLGNLPFGTSVRGQGKELSAGIYWHDNFGDDSGDKDWKNSYTKSIDLDLSAIDDSGRRTGWGGYSAYSKTNPIVFSGDVTSASKGATEFFTVSTGRANRYGLMVNIFRGPTPCKVEVVVGTPDDKVWQESTIIREQTTLDSKQSLIGFLKDDAYIVYTGRLNENRVSKGKHPILDKGFGKLWTVKCLLDRLGIHYDTDPKHGSYTYDLRYLGFSLDKLEAMLHI